MKVHLSTYTATDISEFKETKTEFSSHWAQMSDFFFLCVS